MCVCVALFTFSTIASGKMFSLLHKYIHTIFVPLYNCFLYFSVLYQFAPTQPTIDKPTMLHDVGVAVMTRLRQKLPPVSAEILCHWQLLLTALFFLPQFSIVVVIVVDSWLGSNRPQ